MSVIQGILEKQAGLFKEALKKNLPKDVKSPELQSARKHIRRMHKYRSLPASSFKSKFFSSPYSPYHGMAPEQAKTFKIIDSSHDARRAIDEFKKSPRGKVRNVARRLRRNKGKVGLVAGGALALGLGGTYLATRGKKGK